MSSTRTKRFRDKFFLTPSASPRGSRCPTRRPAPPRAARSFEIKAEFSGSGCDEQRARRSGPEQPGDDGVGISDRAHGIDFGLDLLLGHGGSFDCGHAFRRFEKFIRRAAADFLAQELLDFRVGEQARLRGFLGEMPGSDCWRRVGMLRWPSKWLSQRNQP
jgi:hypothetical protein